MNAEYLREILNYNWKTGIFRWAKPRPKVRVGAVAGHKHHKGHNKKHISLGYYDTAEEAHAVYVAKAKELHGEFVRAK